VETFSGNNICSAVHGFWPVEKLVELAGVLPGCGEMARGGCLFASNYSVTSSTVLAEAGRKARTNMTHCCVSYSLPACRTKIMHCTKTNCLFLA
jgi:hypothetical protein